MDFVKLKEITKYIIVILIYYYDTLDWLFIADICWWDIHFYVGMALNIVQGYIDYCFSFTMHNAQDIPQQYYLSCTTFDVGNNGTFPTTFPICNPPPLSFTTQRID